MTEYGYEVYLKGENHRTICVCKDLDFAVIIAKTLALYANPTPNGRVYVSNVGRDAPYDIVPGGGWYECYYKDENGDLQTESLV